MKSNPKWLDPCTWASNTPTNVYFNTTDGYIYKTNSITGFTEAIASGLGVELVTPSDMKDMAIDPYGVLYQGTDNGVKRINADTGEGIMPDVGIDTIISGLGIDGSNNVYFNTIGSILAPFYEGIWMIPDGTGTNATQIVPAGSPPITFNGVGMDFLKNGDLIAAGRNYSADVSTGDPELDLAFSKNNRVIRVPLSGTEPPDLSFIDLSRNGPFGEQMPVGVAVNSKGEIFVSTTKVVKEEGGFEDEYRIIPGEGKILKFNSSGQGGSTFATGLYAPSYIGFDMEDNLYVSDPSVGVWKYKPNGSRENIPISNTPGASGIEVE